MKHLNLVILADGKVVKESFTAKEGYCEAYSDAYQHLSACYYKWEILNESYV
jgi:hypothetical protein